MSKSEINPGDDNEQAASMKAYDDNGAVVPITEPVVAGDDLRDQVEELILAAHGTSTTDLLEQSEELVEDVGTSRAADHVRYLLRCLRDTAAGVALQRVVLGDEGESLRTAGRRAKVSHTALWKAELVIQKRLRVSSPAVGRNRRNAAAPTI